MYINIYIILAVMFIASISIVIWKYTKKESYWPQTEYAYTYIDSNGNESNKSPSTTTNLQTGSEADPSFSITPNGSYEMKMYRRISGLDWEVLGTIPAGSVYYQDTKAVPHPPPEDCLQSGDPFKSGGGKCAKPCCKNTCFKNNSFFCSDNACPENVPRPTCCSEDPNSCGACHNALC